MFKLAHLFVLSILVLGANCRGCFDSDDKEISGECYKFVNQKMTFKEARDWCHYKNPVTQSYLAVIQNQFTANFLASYARTEFGSNDATFWIGLSREKNWKPFTWDNGYQLGQSWSNFDDKISLNYVAERVSNAKWTTLADDSRQYFVCSYDPTDPPTFTPQTPTKPVTTTTTTTTTSAPTTTVNFPPCSKPFNGKIALAYEMTKRKQTKGVLNFIKKYLYNSLNYKFDDGTTQAINVPYPDSGVYENYILHYPDATSAEMLDINIDQLYSEVMVLTDAKIERAYEYILEERDPGNSTTNVLITIGVDDEAVFDGSATNYLHQLQNKYGFRSLVVSIGPQENYLGKLAESEDWYFTATEANSQWVADQISRIICHL